MSRNAGYAGLCILFRYKQPSKNGSRGGYGKLCITMHGMHFCKEGTA